MRFVPGAGGVEPRLGQLVAGDLFCHETVVGQVLIESADQVITVSPGAGDGVVEFMSFGLGISDDVHPMPGPSLTEARGGKIAIDHAFIGSVALIVQVTFQFRRRRRQTGQHHGHPPDQSRTTGLRARLQAGLLQSSFDEMIDGMPLLIFQSG